MTTALLTLAAIFLGCVVVFIVVVSIGGCIAMLFGADRNRPHF